MHAGLDLIYANVCCAAHGLLAQRLRDARWCLRDAEIARSVSRRSSWESLANHAPSAA